jgi:4-hydroxy 2-oxovalerate aldolase
VNKFNILEDTCRDSLYVSNFLIESEVISEFAGKISDIGIEYIEIGHPLGLGAYRKYSSGFTDEQLFSALQGIIEKNKVFCFFIPGIGDMNDLQLLKSYGLYGVRAGINATELNSQIRIVESIKKRDIFVCLNLMKTYTVSPKEYAKNLKDVKDLIDVIYVVDSAGCMFPEDVKTYINTIQDEIGDIKIGFHGHNNLNLVMANALAAIECGADFIDTTLGGIGRSGGNVPTEALLAIMNRKGMIEDENILLRALKITRDFRSYLIAKGIHYSVKEEDALFGYASFHSSFEDIVKNFSEREGVDFHKMVIEISKVNKTVVDNQVLEEALKRYKKM